MRGWFAIAACVVGIVCGSCDAFSGWLEDSERAGEAEPREPKVHRSGSSSPRPASPLETAIKHGSQTRQAIYRVLLSLRADGIPAGDARDRQIGDVVDAMAAEGHGEDATRRLAAGELMDILADEMAARPLDGVEDVALWRMARSFEDAMLGLLEADVPEGVEGQTNPDPAHQLANHLVPDLRAVDGHRIIEWSDVSGWTHVRGKPIPAEVLALNGQPVTMGGFMIELDYDDDNQVVLFLLVESLWDCCFGEPPTIEQGVVVTVPSGTPATTGPIQISGVLEVGEFFEEGELIGVHRMTTDNVQRLR